MLLCVPALAQDDSAEALAERSTIVVSGKVVKVGASAEPLLAASSRTAVISVQRMYAGREIAGDQTGRTATVILSRPERLKVGDEAYFFGNVRFVGRSLTIADEGEIPSSGAAPAIAPDVERGVQARKDGPVLERLSAANMVFRGTVESVRALEPDADEAKRGAARRGEHDPEWRVASVRIVTPLRGGDAGQVVTVMFPSSRDVVWFNSPKLASGQDAVFITHAPDKEEAALAHASAVVTHPFDVLPPADEARVRALIARGKEKR